MQADCYIYDDVNRQFGVDDADYARWERRIKLLCPGIARIFLPTSEFNPSGDGKTYDWNTIEMQRQYRNLAVLKAAGARVNLCMGPWTNKVMTEPGSERLAVDLVEQLVNERGCDYIAWLSLFNEPDAIYAPDSDLNRELESRGFGGGLPFADYVGKHQAALALLQERDLSSQVRPVVGDMAWPPARRLEWLRLLAPIFGTTVSYSYHHYAPGEGDYDVFFDRPESACFRPLPLKEEVAGYRDSVGPDTELICWEFNHAGWNMGGSAAFLGVGQHGEDHAGSFATAVAHTRKVLTMLSNGVDAMSHWCVGDMFYRSGLKQGVMYCGLWRYKWQSLVPRPVYFYYAALLEVIRPGCELLPISGLPATVTALGARDAQGHCHLGSAQPRLGAGVPEASAGTGHSVAGHSRAIARPSRHPRPRERPGRGTAWRLAGHCRWRRGRRGLYVAGRRVVVVQRKRVSEKGSLMRQTSPDHQPIKLMHCDLNWVVDPIQRAASPHDWAFIDPEAYFDWHMAFGTNVMYSQAYLFGGTALYPSRLGPVAPGPGSQIFPRLYTLARERGVPVWSYFCVGADLVMSNHRNDWVVPGSRGWTHLPGEFPFSHGFLAPESGWTDLLCARVREFLTLYPVDWLLFDWFGYGGLRPDTDPVVPADYARPHFRRITGRDMPALAAEITLAEQMTYKRSVLAEQFYLLRDAVKETSPDTRILFNVPYWQPAESIWLNHPMLKESDGLFAECSRREVVDWLLEIRRPEQRVMTTITGRQDDGECDPNSWREWYDKGCDFFGYAWGTPPDFRPHPRCSAELEIVRKAFREIQQQVQGDGSGA